MPSIRNCLLFLAGLAVVACAPRAYHLLSPEDDYSDDGSVSVQVRALERLNSGATAATLHIANRRSEPIALGEAKFLVVDADEAAISPATPPGGEVAAGGTRTLELSFPTEKATGNTWELRVEGLPVKIWPIIFSTEKPPDFKATPTPAGPQGPGRGPY